MVVQLVRIPACHAGGRGFESRPYRKKSLQEIDFQSCRFFLCPKKCTKNAPNPFLCTPMGVFYPIYPILFVEEIARVERLYC